MKFDGQPRILLLDSKSRIKVAAICGFFSQRAPIVFMLVLLFTVSGFKPARGAENFDLRAAQKTGQMQRIRVAIQVGGNLKTKSGGKVRTLPLKVAGTMQYDERLVAVDEAQRTQRTLRHYDQAEATIEIDGQAIQSVLDPALRVVVFDETKDRGLLYSPQGPLTREDVDLIDVPGNSATLARLLPREEVKLKDRWTLDQTTLCRLLGLDAISQSDVHATLETVANKVALISMAGTIDAAVGGVATQVKLAGECRVDLATRQVVGLSMTISEDRSIGHAEPGFVVEAKVQLTSSALGKSAALDNASHAPESLEPTAGATALSLIPDKGGFRLLHDRRWRVLIDQKESLVLRLVDRGDLIAQCNISTLPKLSAGRSVELEQLQEEIQRSLGASFGQFSEASQNLSDEGVRILRVAATGTASDIPVSWIYYLLSDEAGRRVSIVFAHESKLQEQFGDADRMLVGSFAFADAQDDESAPQPTPASQKPATAAKKSTAGKLGR